MRSQRTEEMQAKLNPYAGRVASKDVEAKLARRYQELFDVFRENREAVQRVTF